MDLRGFPVKKLVYRLDLHEYDVDAPLTDVDKSFDVVNIPCKQHIGAPATAVVKDGDYVSKNDLIYSEEGKPMGVNMHASIDGMVKINGNKITIMSERRI